MSSVSRGQPQTGVELETMKAHLDQTQRGRAVGIAPVDKQWQCPGPHDPACAVLVAAGFVPTFMASETATQIALHVAEPGSSEGYGLI